MIARKRQRSIDEGGIDAGCKIVCFLTLYALFPLKIGKSRQVRAMKSERRGLAKPAFQPADESDRAGRKASIRDIGRKAVQADCSVQLLGLSNPSAYAVEVDGGDGRVGLVDALEGVGEPVFEAAGDLGFGVVSHHAN